MDWDIVPIPCFARGSVNLESFLEQIRGDIATFKGVFEGLVTFDKPGRISLDLRDDCALHLVPLGTTSLPSLDFVHRLCWRLDEPRGFFRNCARYTARYLLWDNPALRCYPAAIITLGNPNLDLLAA